MIVSFIQDESCKLYPPGSLYLSLIQQVFWRGGGVNFWGRLCRRGSLKTFSKCSSISMGNSKLGKSKFKACLSQLLTFFSHMYNIHLGCWSQKMLQLFVCFTEKLKWNCCLVSIMLRYSFLFNIKFPNSSFFVCLFICFSMIYPNETHSVFQEVNPQTEFILWAWTSSAHNV